MSQSESISRQASLSRLPAELVLLIAAHLERHDLSMLARISKRFYSPCVEELYRRDVSFGDHNAILWAARHDLPGTAELAIRFGAIAESLVRETVLQSAARHGSPSVGKVLLSSGADLSSYKNIDSPLVIASEYGRPAVIELFLNDLRAALPSVKGLIFELAMFRAAGFGHEQVLAHLISHPGADVDAHDSRGMTLLMEACQQHQASCVRLLAHRHGADVNLRDEDRQTALHIAARYGDLDVVRFLLEVPEINVNCRDRLGRSPLYEAAARGQVTTVELLLKRPDLLVNLPAEFLHTALSLTSSSGRAEVVRLLCQRDDINLNWQSTGGCSALLLATMNEHLGVVECLTEMANVDTNLPDSKGNTPLIIAIGHGNVAMVKAILRHPLLEVSPSKLGWSPLHHACNQWNDEVAEFLLGMPGIDVNLKVANNATVLNCAIINGRQRLVKVLLERDDIDVNLDNPLSFAVKCHKKKIVRMLLAHPDIQVNAHWYGRPTLASAVLCPNSDIVNSLLDHPTIDVNARDAKGRTVLEFAVLQGSLEKVTLLLQHPNIDLMAKNTEGLTPLEVAEAAGRNRIATAKVMRQYYSRARLAMNLGGIDKTQASTNPHSGHLQQ